MASNGSTPKRILVMGAVCALSLGLGVSGSSADASPEDAARAAADSWLMLVDTGKYGEAWDQAAALFKRAITREQWKQMLGGVRGPLGELVSRTIKFRRDTRQLPGAPDGQYVVLQFDTVFTNKAKAVETVTPMLDEDGKWRVSGYYIK